MGDCFAGYLVFADENKPKLSLPNPTLGGRTDEDTVSSFSRPKNPNFSQYVHRRAICDHLVACTVDQEERFAERINIDRKSVV